MSYKPKPSKVTVSHFVQSSQTKRGFSLAGGFVLLVLVICFGYVTYRALDLGITNDEMEVLSSIHRNSYRDLVLGVDWNSQAHFLNVLLTKPCVEFLPLNEIAAGRVPSLLGLLLFLCGIWKVGTLFPTGLTRALITVALVSNAFLLDYLALSRGYGLALGFCVLSLSFLLEASLVPSVQDESTRRQAARSLWLAAGSAVSNMAFLYFYAAVLIVTLWFVWRRHFKLSFHWYSSAVLLGAFYLPRVITTRKENSLFWGGNVGFVHDTVASLVRATFYDFVPSVWLIVVLSVAVTLLVCFLAYWSYHEGINGAFIFSAMTALIAAFCIGAHAVWNVKYPIERSALFLVPLVALDIGVVAAWSRHGWLRLSLWTTLLGFTGVGLSGVNLSHTQTWRKNADIAWVLRDLGEVHKQTGQGIQLALSDGSKWTAWYYAAHLLELSPKSSSVSSPYLRVYDWLALYEWRALKTFFHFPTDRPLLPGTNYLLLDRDDEHSLRSLFGDRLIFVQYYPHSDLKLYTMTKPELHGELTFPNGRTYSGDIKDGDLNGNGTLLLPDGGKYVGEFRDGVANGRGTATYADGGQYIGEFRDGLANGQGVIMLADGQKYTGGFADDKPDGQGVYTWPDGRKYVGGFHKCQLDGMGKMIYPDGRVEDGLWKDGKFLGPAQ